MITREDLNALSPQEIQDKLDHEVENYEKEVEQMSIVDAEEAEANMIKTMEEYDQYLNGISYALPNTVKLADKDISRKTICSRISTLIADMEIGWSYTAGMFQLFDFWAKDADTKGRVEYKVFDSTIRILQQLKYKGSQKWLSGTCAYQLLKGASDEYTKDTSYLIFLASMH
ncbi:MAG: hypothetical protein IKU29_02455, partial [Parabacteroides sp.]|nr:hypothetical protein [Parabacteroides sp.]